MIKHSSSPGESSPSHAGETSSLPPIQPALEEAAAARPGAWAAAVGFAVARLAEASAADGRPVLFAASGRWLGERGRFFGPGMVRLGLPRDRWLLVRAEKETAVLWAAEEALRSGAVAGVLAAVEAPSLVATRRLDLSAREGGALAVALRARPPNDLSAARVRWRVGAAPSAPHPFDEEAPGAVRWRVEATRRRDGPPAAWTVEVEDETGRLRVVPGLADRPPLRRPARDAA